MKTILSKISFRDLLSKPVMLDANILMVGIEDRISDSNYSFDRMKEIYLIPLFESFTHIIVHNEVYRELDNDSRALVDSYKGKNVFIVQEDNLYGKDPQYTSTFNEIASHNQVNYHRDDSKNRGEVFSLAYAAYNKVNYFCSKDVLVDLISDDIPIIRDIEIITFDFILLLAFLYHNKQEDHSYDKALKSIYKRYCEDVIKRHKLPKTLSEYIKESSKYLIASA